MISHDEQQTMTGDELRAWRETHGWTQQHAANEFGYTVDTWRSWELGRRPIREPLIRAISARDQLAYRRRTRREGRS